jgi:hypothetical protein
MNAGKTVLQSLHEVAVVKFGFAKTAKGRGEPVGARAGPANGVTAGAQFLQQLFAMLPLRIPRVGVSAPQESYY